MALPTFVAAGAMSSGTAAITPAHPAGIATDDILLLFLETSAQEIGIATLNGGTWTLVPSSPQQVSGSDAGAVSRLTVFWSRYNGTQTAPVTTDSGDHQVGVILAFRGCSTTGHPWDVTNGSTDGASNTALSAVGNTTRVADCLIVIASARGNDAAGAGFSAWANADLANVTERFDDGAVDGTGGGIGIATGELATAGAYGATTATVSTSGDAFVTIALRPPAPAGPFTLAWFLEADMDRNGSYETDLLPYTAAFAGDLSVRRGVNPDGSFQVSTFQLPLDNTSGDWTPELSTSAQFGKVYPAIPVRWRATYDANYVLWQGYITDLELDYAPAVRSAQFTAEDIFGLLSHYQDISATVSTTRRTDQGINQILTNVGLTSTDWNLGLGEQTMTVHYAAGDEAIDAVMEVVRSELGGLLWASATGKITFEGRSKRLGIAVDQTWGDGTTVVPIHERYVTNMQQLITRVSVEVTPFVADPAAKKASRWGRGSSSEGGLDDSIAIAAGQTYTVRARYGSPASSAITPVATDDYKGNASADGGGTNKTANLTVTFTDYGGEYEAQIRNDDAATVYLTKWGVRGTGRHPELTDSTPIFRYNLPIPLLKIDGTLDLKLNLIDDAPTTAPIAQDYAYYLLRKGRYPAPRLHLTFAWKNAATITAMLSAEIGQRIDYANTGLTTKGSNVDDIYYIEAIEHSVPTPAPNGASAFSTITLVPAWAYGNLGQIIYDTFNRANGNINLTDNAKTWANVGDVDIASNVAKSAALTVQNPNIDLTRTDCIVEASLGLTSFEATGRIGLIWRFTDTSNYWRAYIENDGDLIVLAKVVAGVTTIVSSVAYTLGTTAEMRVVVQGNRHRVFVDRKLYIDQTDSALNAQTRVGMYCLNTVLGTWDNFYAIALN